MENKSYLHFIAIPLYNLIIESDFPFVIAPDLHKLTQYLHKNEHKKRGYCLT